MNYTCTYPITYDGRNTMFNTQITLSLSLMMCSTLELHTHVFIRSYIWSIYTTDSYYYLMNFAILMKYMIMKLLVYFFGCLGGYLTEFVWTYYVHFFMYGRKFIEAYRC